MWTEEAGLTFLGLIWQLPITKVDIVVAELQQDVTSPIPALAPLILTSLSLTPVAPQIKVPLLLRLQVLLIPYKTI